MSAAADPGGGAALVGASVAPPPLLTPPTLPESHQHSPRPIEAGQCARLRALSATLPTPDREIILLWAVAGVSTPDIVTTLGVTPAAVRHAQHQALSTLPPPPTTAPGPSPATRQQVVLLPHVRNHPNNHRAEKATGMNHDNSPQPPPAQNGGTTGVIATNTQWHDAELALRVARHSFDRWLLAGHQDTPSLAIMHVHHTHVALHEAARALTMLLDTVHTQTAPLITTPEGEQ